MIEKIHKNNLTIALNVLHASKKKIYIYIYTAYVSRHNSNCEKEVILLMIPMKKMALSCSKETISIIKMNNI